VSAVGEAVHIPAEGLGGVPLYPFGQQKKEGRVSKPKPGKFKKFGRQGL
jgi:hypothetical protein